MKFFALFIYNITLLASCTKIIEIDLPKHPQKPVVSCFFTKDSTFRMQLTKSVGILDDYQDPIDNATIYLFENDIRIDTLKYNGQFFESDIVAKVGKTYAFTTKIENFDEVSASDYIPQLPVLGDCSISDIFIALDEEDVLDQQVYIEVYDILPKNNYYELVLLDNYIDPFGEYQGSLYSYSTSPIIENENILSVYPESLVFSDELFNNDVGIIELSYRMPYYIDENGYHYIEDYSLIVVLRSITKPYYTYKKKLYQHLFNQENDGWNGIGEPTQMYSNIKGGYGIFAGYSEVRQEITPE